MENKKPLQINRGFFIYCLLLTVLIFVVKYSCLLILIKDIVMILKNLREYYLGLFKTFNSTSDIANSLDFNTIEEHIKYILSSLKRNNRGEIIIEKQSSKLLKHLKYLYKMKLFQNQSILTDLEMRNKNRFYLDLSLLLSGFVNGFEIKDSTSPLHHLNMIHLFLDFNEEEFLIKRIISKTVKLIVYFNALNGDQLYNQLINYNTDYDNCYFLNGLLDFINSSKHESDSSTIPPQKLLPFNLVEFLNDKSECDCLLKQWFWEIYLNSFTVEEFYQLIINEIKSYKVVYLEDIFLNNLDVIFTKFVEEKHVQLKEVNPNTISTFIQELFLLSQRMDNFDKDNRYYNQNEKYYNNRFFLKYLFELILNKHLYSVEKYNQSINSKNILLTVLKNNQVSDYLLSVLQKEATPYTGDSYLRKELNNLIAYELTYFKRIVFTTLTEFYPSFLKDKISDGKIDFEFLQNIFVELVKHKNQFTFFYLELIAITLKFLYSQFSIDELTQTINKISFNYHNIKDEIIDLINNLEREYVDLELNLKNNNLILLNELLK